MYILKFQLVKNVQASLLIETDLITQYKGWSLTFIQGAEFGRKIPEQPRYLKGSILHISCALINTF